MASRSFLAKLLFLTGGLLVWAGHFAVVYGFNALACERGLDRASLFGFGAIPLTIAGATLVAFALDGLLLAHALGARGPGVSDEPESALRDFWRWIAGAVAALSLLAVAWTALPVLIVTPCA